jgi:hypothetical protein
LAPTNTDKSVAAQDAGTPALLAETERIAAALEPQLRQVIDTTMQRVAEIERQTRDEAMQATASTEHASRDALERSSRLVDDLETLTGTVGQVTSRLRAEFDDVTRSLRGLREARVQLPGELVRRDGAAQAHEEPPPVEAAAPEPAPEPPQVSPTVEQPDPEIEPSEELTEMFREQITKMRDDGKSRDEAERVLLRFRLGHRFLGMLDDIYLSAPPASAARRKRGLFGRRRRGS